MIDIGHLRKVASICMGHRLRKDPLDDVGLDGFGVCCCRGYVRVMTTQTSPEPEFTMS